MLPPLLKLAISEPGLLAAHLEAYSGLVVSDFTHWQKRLERRLLLIALLGIGGIMSVALACVALMLWATTQHGSPLLIVVPLCPFVLAASIYALNQPLPAKDFEATRTQFRADVQMLKEEPDRD